MDKTIPYREIRITIAVQKITIIFFCVQSLLMNITQILDNMSDESLLAIGVFSFALFFYVTRLIGLLKTQLRTYEEADKSGRESFESDLKILNGLLDELRHEFTDLQDDLETQLVKHEMTTLSMNPKFKRIEQLISRTLERQNSSLSELNASFRNIDSSIVGIGAIEPNGGINSLNELLPKLIQKIRNLDENGKFQSSFVNEMQRDLELVKRACGVD